MEVLIQSNLVTPRHQVEHLYLTPKKQKVDVKTTKIIQDEKNPRTEEKHLPKLWQNPQTYAVQALHSPWHRTMLRLQSALFHISIDFFRQMNYDYLVVPLTTGSISSPMGLGSDSQPVSIQLNNNPTYLADSQQFLLEYALRLQEVPKGVYYAGTSCRGEDHDTTHLNQFCHVECELLGGLEAGMDVANQYIINLTQSLLTSHGPEIARYAGTTSHMQQLLQLYSTSNNSFPTITLSEVLVLPELTDEMWEFVVPGKPAYGRLLTRKGEQMLIAKFRGACWLTEMDHLSVPFYQAYVPGTQEVAKAQCADFLLGMGEVLGCGNRHVSRDQAMHGLREHGVNPEDYKWYLNMRKEKELNTTGWGIGTERYMCWVLGHDDVRDVQIFPRLKGLECAP
jgi:aspartyl/asparaginyl-tRNA synthetase